MGRLIFSSLLSLLFVGVARAHMPTVIAEATQRPWQPSIKIEDSLVPSASEVRLGFDSPKLALELHKSEEGLWIVELSSEQVNLLLQDQEQKIIPAELTYVHSTAKISATKDSKKIEVLMKRSAP